MQGKLPAPGRDCDILDVRTRFGVAGGKMGAEPTANVQISEADVDALVEHMRRAGRPFTLTELVNILQELWRRRRERH